MFGLARMSRIHFLYAVFFATASVVVAFSRVGEDVEDDPLLGEEYHSFDFALDYTLNSLPVYFPASALAGALQTPGGVPLIMGMETGLKNSIPLLAPASIDVAMFFPEGFTNDGLTFPMTYEISSTSREDLLEVQAFLSDARNVNTTKILTDTAAAILGTDFAYKSVVTLAAVSNPTVSNHLVVETTTTTTTSAAEVESLPVSIDFDLTYSATLPGFFGADALIASLLTPAGSAVVIALIAALQGTIPGLTSENIAVTVTGGNVVSSEDNIFKLQYRFTSSSIAELTTIQELLSDARNVNTDRLLTNSQTAIDASDFAYKNYIVLDTVADPVLRNQLTTPGAEPVATTTTSAAAVIITTTDSPASETRTTTAVTHTINFQLDYSPQLPSYIQLATFLGALQTPDGKLLLGALVSALRTAISALAPENVAIPVEMVSATPVLGGGNDFTVDFSLSSSSLEELMTVQTFLVDSRNINLAQLLEDTTIAIAASSFSLKSFVVLTAITNPNLANMLATTSPEVVEVVTTTTPARIVGTSTTTAPLATTMTATTTSQISIFASRFGKVPKLKVSLDITFTLPTDLGISGAAILAFFMSDPMGEPLVASLKTGLRAAFQNIPEAVREGVQISYKTADLIAEIKASTESPPFGQNINVLIGGLPPSGNSPFGWSRRRRTFGIPAPVEGIEEYDDEDIFEEDLLDYITVRNHFEIAPLMARSGTVITYEDLAEIEANGVDAFMMQAETVAAILSSEFLFKDFVDIEEVTNIQLDLSATAAPPSTIITHEESSSTAAVQTTKGVAFGGSVPSSTPSATTDVTVTTAPASTGPASEKEVTTLSADGQQTSSVSDDKEGSHTSAPAVEAQEESTNNGNIGDHPAPVTTVAPAVESETVSSTEPVAATTAPTKTVHEKEVLTNELVR